QWYTKQYLIQAHEGRGAENRSPVQKKDLGWPKPTFFSNQKGFYFFIKGSESLESLLHFLPWQPRPPPNQSSRGSFRPARIITGDSFFAGSSTRHRRSNFFLCPREPPPEQERATAAASPSNFQIRVQQRNVASPLQVLLELSLI
ncbi:hypothetical protein VIGAN_04206600, partial [Vigna angularis var. angularis]